jgi:hypothetical protein
MNFAGNLILIAKKYAQLLHLPMEQISAMEPSYDRLTVLVPQSGSPLFNKVDMQEKRTLRKELTALIRAFVRNHLQNNDDMTDVLRAEFGIPIHSTTRTPNPTPKTIPELQPSSPKPRVIHIKFRDAGAESWCRPEKIRGLEVVWLISDTPPKLISELTNSEFATRNPLKIVFEEDMRGKRIYFAARWENSTAKKGLWSEILSEIIS